MSRISSDFKSSCFSISPWRLPIKSNETNKVCVPAEVRAFKYLDASITWWHTHKLCPLIVMHFAIEVKDLLTFLCSQISAFSHLKITNKCGMAFASLTALLCLFFFFVFTKHCSSWAFWPAFWKLVIKKIAFFEHHICFTADPRNQLLTAICQI